MIPPHKVSHCARALAVYSSETFLANLYHRIYYRNSIHSNLTNHRRLDKEFLRMPVPFVWFLYMAFHYV